MDRPAAAALAGFLIGGWELFAKLGHVENYLLPAPSEVASALSNDRDLLAPDAWVTAREVLLGFALALVIGVAVAIALHLSPLLRRAAYPLVVASQAIPVVVIAPILVIWFGFGITPKLIVIALICFFPVVVNTLDGLEGVDREQVEDDAHARRLAPRPAEAPRASFRAARSCSRAPRWRSPSR